EDGVESSGSGTNLQGELGDCVDEDGPISPSERSCGGGIAVKEDEDGEGSDDEEDGITLNPSTSTISTRLNPVVLRDTGPPDREFIISRCPSIDSRESFGPAIGSPPPIANRNSTSPVSPLGNIGPLPLGVHPLLPPQSAAMMAAYLQQTHQRLLLGHSPLSRSSISPIVSSSCSPPAGTTGIHVSPISGDISPNVAQLSTVLDFSTRKTSSTEEDEEEQILNLSKPPTPSSSTETNNGPLDLSVPSRKRPVPEDSPPPPPRKSLKVAVSTPIIHQDTSANVSTYTRQVVSPWTSPVVASHFPYFAAAVAAAATSQQQLSPKNNTSVVDHHHLWNGKIKPSVVDKSYQPSEATKALEKMSELSKLSGEDLFKSTSGTSINTGGTSIASSSRHSAWQSHWLNKGADQAKDVLKCVWCKQSFPTLAAMTAHMKEAKHCGVNMAVPPPVSGLPTQQPHHSSISQTSPQSHHLQTSSSGSGNNTNSTSISKQNPSELNLLIKETMPLPRKLVRGQDVWLGKGAEQTRQILKCMWCGQSFRSLAEMTSHMQQTQHYTNIISQEQIISWKSSDENKGVSSGGGSGITTGSSGGVGSAAPGSGSGLHGTNTGHGVGTTSSHVSAVLTCKVCDQAFTSLKELSNHMVKNSHYKEHIMRSITESGGRRRQTREKRKKSLPVRKLLELERAQNEFKNGDVGNTTLGLGKHTGRITCEKCGEKIETTIFVDHIRQCIGAGTLGVSQRNFLKNALMSNHLPTILTPGEYDRKTINEENSSISLRHHRSPSSASDTTTHGKETPTSGINESCEGTSSPSVLNAIEKLIEKSFDSRIRHGSSGIHHAQPGAPIGSSILKRLGIDESVDYTKPLVDSQTMNLLRSYQQQHLGTTTIIRRERSGSESSSISERGSGRTDTMTPERRIDPVTTTHDRLSSSSSHSNQHRATPDKQVTILPSSHPLANEESEEDELSVVIKKEPNDENIENLVVNENGQQSESLRRIVVKKEIIEDGTEEDESQSYNHRMSSNSIRESSEERKDVSPQMNPPTPKPLGQVEQLAHSPSRNSTSSPASSDRSVTPRGTPDNKTSSSLGALSSMFDSLSGGGNLSNTNNADSQGRKTSSHPLAALQKLCDKTETRGSAGAGNTRSGPTSNTLLGSGSGSTSITGGVGASSTPGAILAFSWACNEAVVTADSIMKCAFCDTPFISKGAYRHHLSKMHFVKDGVIPDPSTISRSTTVTTGTSVNSQTASSGPSHSSSSPPPSQRNKSPPILQTNGSPSQSTTSPLEESPHSKFLKYTELAKQLSSKYV
ncbi:PREDICTED: protein tiptop, partial [Ceratosolen solmsi marchali]|uniref:Protein tiptop n=1 Tax=Ceratosolen solmsi marchali TaxID=326594 RepID=A0AAJ6YTF2_9HYME